VFERFTRQARDVVRRAVDAAHEVRAARIDTGHLLVALARDAGPAGETLRQAGVTADRLLSDLGGPGGGRIDPDALRALGIDYAEVRRAVETEFGAGALDRALDRSRTRWRRTGRGTRFAPEAKQALERALRAAIDLRDRHIGAEHILLGVLADPSFRAARLLDRWHVDVGALRRSAAGHRERRAS
jgi:ATP-dependent Clp protease ATP-binding subunit ClpA